MAVSITVHDSLVPLADLLDFIKAGNESWGLVTVKRNYLRIMTTEAFLLAIQPALEEAKLAHVFFVNDKLIYIAWCGPQRAIYNKLRNNIGIVLMQPGVFVEPGVVVNFLDPVHHTENIKSAILRVMPAAEKEKIVPLFREEEGEEKEDYSSLLNTTEEQRFLYSEISKQKPSRQQMHFLVVEDQVFSQKLLCEILRGVRLRNNNETPIIDTAQGIQEGWKLFLKKAPDMTFIDLNLLDGSGHTLARAIKEVDPNSQVIIVTANDFEEEMNVARQNNVDNFITKPYNKKQIFDCIDKYIDAYKSHVRTRHGGYIR